MIRPVLRPLRLLQSLEEALINFKHNFSSEYTVQSNCSCLISSLTFKMSVFRSLLYCISESCPNIVCLKLGAGGCFNNFYPEELEWCCSVTKFENLEKLEIDLYFCQTIRSRASDYNPFMEMVQHFIDNPMPKMKELKLCGVNAFFQDEFLSNLCYIFPNLETFILVKLGKQGIIDERIIHINLSY